MHGWGEPEHEHTDGAHRCEHHEHAAVDRQGHPVLECACRDHGGEPSKTRHRHDESGSHTKHGEQRALDEQLPQEASARRPDRRANGDLAPANRSPHQEKVGHIRAGERGARGPPR
jgi:hypothetical protein